MQNMVEDVLWYEKKNLFGPKHHTLVTYPLHGRKYRINLLTFEIYIMEISFSAIKIKLVGLDGIILSISWTYLPDMILGLVVNKIKMTTQIKSKTAIVMGCRSNLLFEKSGSWNWFIRYSIDVLLLGV